MVYTPTDLQSIHKVIGVFQTYIEGSPYLDLLWSDKIGYILLQLSSEKLFLEESWRVTSAEALADRLFSEIATDVLLMTQNEHSMADADPLELAEIERRCRPYVEQLPEFQHLCDPVPRVDAVE